MITYDKLNSSTILDNPIPTLNDPILIPEKYNRFPKLNSNRLKIFKIDLIHV